jgi:hypothetical protein
MLVCNTLLRDEEACRTSQNYSRLQSQILPEVLDRNFCHENSCCVVVELCPLEHTFGRLQV